MPEVRMIQFAQLSKADIIFTTSNAPESVTIRKCTNSIISHTMLVTKHNHVIEAITPTVRETTWGKALEHAEATVAIAMRRMGLSNAADQDKVVAALTFNNLSYDTYGAASSGMFGNKRNQILAAVGCSLIGLSCAYFAKNLAENVKDENADKSFFCSELVSRAFTEAGFPIVEGKATFANPNAVYRSPWLQYVGHLVYAPPRDPNISKEQFEKNRRSGYRKDY